MNQREFERIQGQICAQMDELYEALRAKVPYANAEALMLCKNTINQSPFEPRDARIQCKIDSVIIRVSVDDIKHLSLPEEDDAPNNAELHLSMDGSIDADLWMNHNENPWEKLSFRAELVIITMKGRYSKSFHVDQIKGNGVASQEVHPQSHLHFSGQNESIRENIYIDVPRLVHYPLDMILGLSVAMQNFAPNTFEKLKEHSIFLHLCYLSQKRLLVPYFNMYTNCIDADGKSNKNIREVCPYLV